MKVVFLDFDGVICTDKVFMSRGKSDPHGPMDLLDEYAVTLISKFCQHHGWGIVVSSTWRTVFTLDELREKLYSAGMDRSVNIVGVIGRKFGGEPRAQLIVDWMDAHVLEDWIVVDDIVFEGFNRKPFRKRFLHVKNKYDGFGYLEAKWMHEYAANRTDEPFSAKNTFKEIYR